MIQVLQIVEIVLALALIASVLLQQRGAGTGDLFGAGGASYHSRRGFESFLYYSTIVMGALFALAVLANIYLATH